MSAKRFAFLVLFSAFLISAVCRADGTYFGLEVGPDIIGFSTPGADSATQFTGGVLLETYLVPQLSLQPELRYTNKSSGTASAQYLQIPVLFKGHLPMGTMVTPNVAVGPDFNLKLSAPTGAQTFLMAIDFGAGADFDVMPSALLSFDFRYSLGLTDLIDGLDSKVHEIEFLFGVKFKL